ncbi:MAG: lipocalin family protein [Bacteroidetes bacterium]|nr:lipocalin family protein [Bacteroidota bacterium]
MRLMCGILCLALYGCSSAYVPLDTVASVDLSRYVGVWYEVARLPNNFQEGCYCTTAEYTLRSDGTIAVRNSCRKDSVNGRIDQVTGKAFVVEGSNNAKLKVQFFWPFRGDYWILALGPEYSYAVVGTPNRQYLWILSRTPSLPDDVYRRLLDEVKEKGFDVSSLIRTVHCYSQ